MSNSILENTRKANKVVEKISEAYHRGVIDIEVNDKRAKIQVSKHVYKYLLEKNELIKTGVGLNDTNELVAYGYMEEVYMYMKITS